MIIKVVTQIIAMKLFSNAYILWLVLEVVFAIIASVALDTGDGFLTELTHINGDVVDMEAYAQAFVCRSKEIPFISVKYVTDIIGQNSVKHWEDKLADARQGLSDYFNVLKERI